MSSFTKFAFMLWCWFFPHALMAQTLRDITIERESTFIIRGTSNVNRFSCEITKGIHKKNVTISYSQVGEDLLFKNTRFRLDLKDFDCGNRHITNDFRKALHAEEYPFMVFELLGVEGLFAEDPRKPSAEVLVTIAGCTNKYHLIYQVRPIGHNTFIINLKSKFEMEDFNIIPPTTMLGLIKVDGTIIIELNLEIKMQ